VEEISQRRVEVGDLELEVIEAGAAVRRLLVLHGFCGAKESFAEIMGPLAARGWHVVVPDQRGHGESSHPAGAAAYDFDSFAGDAVGLADSLGWDRFVLLGHSMGGMTAQYVALSHSERLAGLVLMDTSHGPLEIDPEMAAAGRKIVSSGGMQGLVEAMRGLDGPLVTDAHRRLLADRHGYQDQLDAQDLAASPDMWLAMSEAMFGARDRLEQLAGLRLPTLVVVGEQDQPFLAPSLRMAERMPHAALAVIPDAGHSPQLESPRAWLEAVGGFLDSVVAGASGGC